LKGCFPPGTELLPERSLQVAIDKIEPDSGLAGNAPRPGSYGQIVKSSAIIGGAEAAGYGLGLIRIKAAALLLGPAGIGLIGIYTSIVELLSVVSQLGIASSGVQKVAAAGKDTPEALARTVKTLRWASWLAGGIGCLLTAAVARPISRVAFGTDAHSGAIAVLGCWLLFSAVESGQRALLQGVRRIGDLARLNILGGLASTGIAVGIYFWLGIAGVVPVLLTTVLCRALFSWWYARKVKIVPVELGVGEALRIVRDLIGLGLAVMWGLVITTGVGFITRSLIIRDIGIEANGIYQAAWAISGMFALFVLNAMGMDFFPRLAAVAGDNAEVNRLANEQTEIGILLAVPGLLGTLAFAHWIMPVFFSRDFTAGAALLPWLVAGIVGRVVMFPLGYIQLAKGVAWVYAGTQTFSGLLQVGLVACGLQWVGLPGVAVAFAGAHVVQVPVIRLVAGRLSGFRWSGAVLRLFLVNGLLVCAGLAANFLLEGWPGLLVGFLLTLYSSIFSIRGIAARLGPDHRLIRMLMRIPGGEVLCGV
jgi:enterobacterial common antigen flippase